MHRFSVIRFIIKLSLVWKNAQLGSIQKWLSLLRLNFRKCPFGAGPLRYRLFLLMKGTLFHMNQIIIQNFGNLENAPDGDFLNFENRLNRDYIDANGKKFTSSAAQVFSTEDAARSLSEGFPIIFKGIHHAIVQTSLTYRHTYESLYVRIDGSYWNPEPRKKDGGLGGYDNPFRQLTDADIYHNVSFADSKFYLAAWSISTN